MDAECGFVRCYSFEFFSALSAPLRFKTLFEQVLFSAQSLGNETRKKSFRAHCEITESLDDFRYEQNHVFRAEDAVVLVS